MLDRLTSLKLFAAVAANGSFSATARTWGLSPTGVTKHIDAIEAGLGVKLLHRTTRKVTLTEGGRRYLDSIERILADLEDADANASAERLEVAGSLRINAPVSFGVRELMPKLSAFSRQHPGLNIDLGLNDRVVDLVEEGWDMAIRIGRLREQNLMARRIAPCHMVLAASPRYLEERGTPRRLADLASHNCLLYTLAQGGPLDRWVFGREGELSVAVSGTFRASNGDALVAAAVADQGIAYQPSFLMAERIRSGNLSQIVLDAPTTSLPGIFAVYPGSRKPPAKVRAAIDYFAESFGPSPHWDLGLQFGSVTG